MIDSYTIVDFARVAARAAKRRYRWADLADLEQESALAMLEALPGYDPAKGALEPYLMYAAWNRLSNWAWEFVGPVRQRRDRNLGWARGVDLPLSLAAPTNPEELLRRAQFARAVSRVLARFTLSAQIVLTGGAKVAHMAEDLGEDRKALTHEVERGRAMLRDLATDH